jgi:hypothetical protein
MLAACVFFSVMLQTSGQGKLQLNMLREIISECSEGKLWYHFDRTFLLSAQNTFRNFSMLLLSTIQIRIG